MGNIGSGTGSGYPAALDYQTTPEVNDPTPGKTKARAEVPNDLVAAVVAVETELGIDPSGTAADVKTYLQVEHNTDGTHKDNLINALTATTATTATNLSMNGEASATGTTTTTALDLGTVTAGDRIFVIATGGIFGTLPTYPYGAVFKSGTSTVTWFHAVGNPDYSLVARGSNYQTGSFSGICKVTVGGTLVLINTLAYTGGSGLTLANQIYAFFLKKA